LRISWNPNPETDMLEYRLQRSVNGVQNFQQIQIIPHPQTSTVDRLNISPGSLYSFRLAAVDSSGGVSEFSDTVSVGVPNLNWTISQLISGSPTIIAISSFASDPDHSISVLTLNWSNLNNVSLTRNANNLIVTPNPVTYTGPANFTLRLEDPDGFWDQQSISVSFIIPVNNPPQITSTPVTNDTVGAPYQYQVVATDPDPGDTLTFSLINAPGFLNINSVTGLISGNSSITDTGQYPVSVMVQDLVAASDTQNYVLNVFHLTQNQPPQITSTPVTNDTVGVPYQYLVVATDPDPGDTLTFSFTNAPGFLSINSSSGLITGNSSVSDTGNHSVGIQVADQQGASDTQNYNLRVIQLPQPPVVANIPNQTIVEGDTFLTISLDNYVTDPDHPDDQISWSFSGNSQLNVNISSNRIATIGIPHPDWNGIEQITFIATDPTSLSHSDDAIFTVTPLNDPPLITSSPISGATQGNLYQYQVTATDPDSNDVLTFALTTSPGFLSINTQSGLITGTPAANDTGLHNVSLRVEDLAGSSDTQNYSLNVLFSNSPPIVSNIPDQIIQEGEDFTPISLDQFVQDPEDPDTSISWSYQGNTDLIVSISSNRVASIAAPDSNWNGSETVVFIAHDPGGLNDRDTVIFQVTPVNDPPQLLLTEINIPNPNQNIVDLKDYATDIDNSVFDLQWEFTGYQYFQITWQDPFNKLIRITQLDTVQQETGQFIVTDPGNLSDTADVRIIFPPTGNNASPSLANFPANISFAEDTSLTLVLTGLVEDLNHSFNELRWEFFPGQNLSCQHDSLNDQLVFFSTTDWYGITTFRVRVTDPIGAYDEKQAIIEVQPRVDLNQISFTLSTDNEVVVDLQTDLPSQIELSFWVNPELKSTYKSLNYFENHNFRLSSLLIDTVYQYSLMVSDTSGYLQIYNDSTFSTNMQQQQLENAEEIFVYPNPYRPAKGHSVVIFDNLPEKMTGLLVFTPDGRVVYEREIQGVPTRRMPWSVINDEGQGLASGFYIYIVKGENGERLKAGKLAVIR
jgi:hypothetical protein